MASMAFGLSNAECLSYSRATKKATTYQRHDLPRVTRFLKEKGVKKVSEATTAHVQQFQQHLLGSLQPITVRHNTYAASGLLAFAVSREYVDRNVVRNVAKVKAAKNPPRYLSVDEWERLKPIVRNDRLWPLVATAYYTGFRNTELRFLTWPEIDFDRDVITLTNKEGFSLKNRQSRHLAMKGISIYKVSQWLGHSSVNTTMIYAHLAPQDDEINVL